MTTDQREEALRLAKEAGFDDNIIDFDHMGDTDIDCIVRLIALARAKDEERIRELEAELNDEQRLLHIERFAAKDAVPAAEQKQTPDAWLYASIAGPVVLHRIQPIGHAKPNVDALQLNLDKDAAKKYPNAHSCVPLYASPVVAAPQEPTWCPTHQHFKWCQHNGGARRSDGSWGPPDAAPQEPK